MYFDVMVDTVLYVHKQRPATSAELAKIKAAYKASYGEQQLKTLEGMDMASVLPNAAALQTFIIRQVT